VRIKDIHDNEYEVIINKYFKKSDVPKIIGDYMSITEELKEKEIAVDSFTQNFYLFNILFIKYMTNIPLPEDGASIISYVYELINLDLLSQVMDSLPKAEIEKATKWITETLEKLPELITPEFIENISNEVVDKDGI
jgi:hypothetical protein